MKFAFVFFAFTLFVWINISLTKAQNVPEEPFIAQSDGSGEETIRRLEELAVEAKNTGERLFVIARRSKSEKSDQISVSRLAYTRTFLLKMRRFPFETAVFAQGDLTDGEGRLEFYLGSDLRLVTLAKLNKIPKLTCCDDFNPPVKRKLRRNKN